VERCASCERVAGHGTVLVTLTSPRGDYLLCRHCLGRDGEVRQPNTPMAIPGFRARSAAR
jgi:hypothetical protein